MKYTYQIAFNSSDYFDLTPGNNIEMNGEWVTDTKIWRENISDLKITKNQNSAIYDTLESWFTDPTEFSSEIFVKVLKSNVEDSIHFFGIKWGEIDYDKKTYTVQPIVQDLYADNIEINKDEKVALSSNDGFVDYNILSNFNYRARFASSRKFIDTIRRIVTEISSIISANVVSTIINNDDYEDGSNVAETYGIRQDYVTSGQTLMQHAGAYWADRISFKDFQDLMKLFRIYFFFDSNDKLRWEHLRFFIDKLIDNAVDFSSYINEYNDIFSYNTVELPTLDIIGMREEQGHTESNFIEQNIVYNNVRNRPDSQTREFINGYFSDTTFYANESLTFDKLVFSASSVLAYSFSNDSFDTFTSDRNHLTVTSGVGGGSAISKNFTIVVADSLDIDIVTTSITGTMSLEIINGGTLASLSNTISVTATGTTSGEFLLTGTANNAYLDVSFAGSGSFEGYILLKYTAVGANTINNIVIPQTTGHISSALVSNGHFSAANIYANYWKDSGLSRSATFNSAVFDFDNTEYNLRRESVKFYYSNDINPLYGFNDGTRIGMIEKWKRNLTTGFYEIDIIYQEDE